MLEVRGITAGYTGNNVLEHLSVTMTDGEIVTVIGANGAGKTTLLRTISGLLRPRSGSVALDGADLTTMSPAQIVAAGIAHVPEGRKIFPGLSVSENLQMGAYLVRDAAQVKRSLEGILELFPILAERRAQVGTSLSGGEQQMLAIGRALMSSPKVLLLDEPSMGLSPLMAERVVESLQTLRHQGLTMLLVEQNVPLALGLADRYVVLRSGRNVRSGATRDVGTVEDLFSAMVG
jgi:branched-chain amino acid transport system ATP-binding protein